MRYLTVILTALCALIAIIHCFIAPQGEIGGWMSASLAWILILVEDFKNLSESEIKKDGTTK